MSGTTADPETISIDSLENAEIGAAVECHAVDQWPVLDRVSGPNGPDWYDAVAREAIETAASAIVPGLTVVEKGTKVDVKACSLRVSDGDSDRAGRWWFRRSHHDRLVDAGGEYALATYEQVDASSALELSIERCVLVPARTVDVFLAGRWTPCGARHRAAESAQLPVTAIFDDN